MIKTWCQMWDNPHNTHTRRKHHTGTEEGVQHAKEMQHAKQRGQVEHDNKCGAAGQHFSCQGYGVDVNGLHKYYNSGPPLHYVTFFDPRSTMYFFGRGAALMFLP